MKEINSRPIFHFGESVEDGLCDDSCNKHGDCQRTLRDIISPEGKHQYVPKYICVCKENYSGLTCNQCAIGFYGPKCLPCQRNPADQQICGSNGICDDGIHGTGECFCKDPNLDPSHYCEYISDVELAHHQQEDFEMGFIFLMLLAFVCTFLLYAYNRIEALEFFPESIAAVVVGVVIGCILKYFYNGTGLL